MWQALFSTLKGHVKKTRIVMNYHNKIFKSITNTANGEVGDETLFHYKQKGTVVWAVNTAEELS